MKNEQMYGREWDEPASNTETVWALARIGRWELMHRSRSKMRRYERDGVSSAVRTALPIIFEYSS